MALASWMGKTYPEVILKPYQFSSFNQPTADKDGKLHVDANATKLPIPTSDIAYGPCLMAAKHVYDGTTADPTLGATHYYDDSIAAPSWTNGATNTMKLGRLNFYKDVK